ncbi:Ribosome-binding factor A [Galdieria sulphuraria]|uniref:Ribosome-binding factor A n=1 Tax=Galdieria sulphuraria TaxID=130081 RepID=M2X5D6_GALSU|nr:ribosome-binding factor A [Galdieria sulphuraria]EME31705.1 ribosome-binding factor A [Galdieria sulphuraria]GJD10503.1 Ribosome-binding factor A [Galdieria sulphuraria]|eukprot:XP_005708225.1 ribosome-binding factor A [Galdieria sulphuraria]
MQFSWITFPFINCPCARQKVEKQLTKRYYHVRNVCLRDKGASSLICRYKKDARPRTVRRPFRISSLLKRELADILQRYALQENRILSEQNFGLISVVRVDVSPDLRNAKAFISVTGSDTQRTATYQWLQEERKSIKYELSQRIREIRYIPELSFEESQLGETMRTLDILDRLSDDPSFVGMEKAFWEEDQDIPLE